MKKATPLFLCACLIISVSTYSQTYVSGSVSGVWNSAGSPYYVTGDCQVIPVDTLQIMPGVQVLFQGAYKFQVNGRISALGVENDSIVFTNDLGNGGWKGLQIQNSSQSNVMSYCRIEGIFIEDSPSFSGYGCLQVDNSQLALLHSTITGNDINRGAGGVCYFNSQGEIGYCDISYNLSRQYSSGGILLNNSPVIVHHCTIRHNRAEFNAMGGGITLRDVSGAEVSNNLIYKNSGSWGGGIHLIDGNAIIRNNTVTDNEAYHTGGIYCSQSTGMIENCIAWGNTAESNNYQIRLSGGSIEVQYNCVMGGYSGTGNIGSDPFFVFSEAENYHLQPGSPCVDAGNPASPFFLEPQPNGGRINLGAYGNTPQATPTVINSPALLLAPHLIDFGEVNTGNSATRDVFIGNGGDLPLTVSNITLPPHFSISQTIFTLQPGELDTLQLAFSPVNLDTLTGVAHVFSNSGDDSIAVSGIGASNTLSGAVSGTFPAGSTYRIIGNIEVPAGETLVIEPGVRLLFEAGFGFTVYGQLQAVGTAQDSIIFTRNGNGSWRSIHFSGAGNSLMEYCRIDGAFADGTIAPHSMGGGIKIINSEVTVRNCAIRNNKANLYGGGIFIKDCSPLIQSCIIENNETVLWNGGAGIFINGSGSIEFSPIIDHCLIRQNVGSSGVMVYGGTPQIYYNHIEENARNGIYLVSGGQIVGNQILLNNEEGIHLDRTHHTLVFIHNTISGHNSSGIGIFASEELLFANNLLAQNQKLLDVHWLETAIFLNNTLTGGGCELDNIQPSVNALNTIFYHPISGFGLNMHFEYCNFLNLRPGVGNISGDPLFVDPAQGNYQLKPGSPCIDAGHPHPRYNDPDSSRNDMGAYGGSLGGWQIPPPEKLISLENWFFEAGSAPPGSQITVDIPIDNLSDSAITVTFHSLGEYFRAAAPSLLLPPNSASVFQAIFTPDSIGPFAGWILLNSEAGARAVQIKGVGVPGGGTHVSGPVSGEWILQNSPYIVTGDIQVNDSLRIEAGTEVLFSGNYQCLVSGKLTVNGMAALPVKISSVDSSITYRNIKITGGLQSIICGAIIENALTSAGALYVDGGSVLVDSVLFRNNGTSAVQISNGGQAVIENSRFYKNYAAISLKSSSDVMVRNNLFQANRGGASFGSMVSFENSSNAQFENNVLIGNHSATTLGIVMTVSYSAPLIRNNLIINNFSETPVNSSIILTYGGNPQFINNVLYGNQTGGGLRRLISIDGNTPIFLNNIVWNNQADNVIWTYQASPVVEYNDLQVAYPGAGNISQNPLFADTLTLDFHLSPGSPCIDSGSPDSLYNDPDGSRNDMGAFGGPRGNWQPVFNLDVFATRQEIDFGVVPVGQSQMEPFYILNRSAVVQTIENVETPQGFSVNYPQPHIPPGDSVLCEVTFSPPADSVYVGIINYELAGEAITQVVRGRTGPAGIFSGSLPRRFFLWPNYPNPFNPETTIQYQLPIASEVKMVLYNLLGQEVRTLVNEHRPPGLYKIYWNGSDERGNPLSSGMYILRFSAGDYSQSRKLLLVR